MTEFNLIEDMNRTIQEIKDIRNRIKKEPESYKSFKSQLKELQLHQFWNLKQRAIVTEDILEELLFHINEENRADALLTLAEFNKYYSEDFMKMEISKLNQLLSDKDFAWAKEEVGQLLKYIKRDSNF